MRAATATAVFLTLGLGLMSAARADDDQAALAKKRDDKLAEAWVKSGGWFTDYDKALSESKKSGKPILAFFTLTEQASAPCQRFERAAADAKFAEVGKNYVLFLHITSGVKKDRRQDLPKQKGGKGLFPYLVWLDSDGNVVQVSDAWQWTNQQQEIGLVDESGKRIKNYLDLKKKAAAGGNPEKIDLLFFEVQLDKVKFADAEKRLANLGPATEEQKATLEGLRTREEVKPVVDALRAKASGEADIFEAGKKFLVIKRANKPGPVGDPEFEFFWRCLVLQANKEKDAANVEEAIKALKAKFTDLAASSNYFHVGQETWKAYFEEQDRRLDRLKNPNKQAPGYSE